MILVRFRLGFNCRDLPSGATSVLRRENSNHLQLSNKASNTARQVGDCLE